MAMSWTSLTAAKGTTGSIASWVNYAKLDAITTLDEAQALLYQVLRVREMRTQYTFQMPVGGAFVALPTGFLDPIGRMYSPTLNLSFTHKEENLVQRNRNFTTTSGTLDTVNSPLTTTNGSTRVSVLFVNHGIAQGSDLTLAATGTIGGITPVGTFEVVSVTDANNFVVDTVSMTATSSASGGLGASYIVHNLNQTIPNYWSIWSERIYFDGAFVQACTCVQQYYQSLPLLSSTNTTNFLTNRFPHLLRTACLAQAADFMKDDGEYQKCMTRLQALVDRTNLEADLIYRGAEINTETP